MKKEIEDLIAMADRHGWTKTHRSVPVPLLREIACHLAQAEALTAAVQTFLAIWPAAEKAINGACAIAGIHGVPYTGPTLNEELTAMREAVSAGVRKE